MRCSRRARARHGVLWGILLAAAPAPAAAAPCTALFGAAQAHAVGGAPQAIALGDLDGDGRLDAVVANGSANTFSVLRGVSGGGFAAAVSVSSGTNPRSVALADLDEDGVLDLLLGSSGGVQRWRGRGDGTFTLTATLDAGTSSRAIVAADLNADGILDVASANSAANEVQVLLGLGSGGVPSGAFAPAVRLAVGAAPGRLIACDLDGDGALDLVTADNSGGTVSVLRGLLAGGRPAGAFAASVRTTVGGSPAGLAMGDVDRDGRPDLLVTHGGGSTLTVLRGLAGGGFAPSTYTTPFAARELALADADGDGIADAVMACAGTNQLAVMSGLATGGFAAARLWSTGSSPTVLAVADLDGDQRPDVVVGNTGGTTLSRFMGACTPHPDAAIALLSPAGGEPWWPGLPQRVRWQRGAAVTAVDVELSSDDGATWQVLATALPGSEATVFAPPPVTALARVRVRDRQVRTRSAASAAPFDVCGLLAGPIESAGGLPGARQVVTADLDADGIPDAVIAGDDALALARGLGDGTFSPLATVAAAAPRALAAADLDRDGLPELLTLEDGQLVVRRGGAPAVAASVRPLGAAGQGLAIADLDGDGDLDVAVVTGGASGALLLFEGDGGGGLAAAAAHALGSPAARVLAADLDGDGALELTLTTASTLEVWRRVGGAWTRASERLLASPVGDLAWGDFDRDGRLDLAACLLATGDVWRFRGTGEALSFESPSAFRSGGAPAHLAATDWDGDGLADLALGSSEAAGLSLLLGDASPGAGAGAFAPVARFGEAGTSGAAIAVADLDGDGAPDALLAQANGRLVLRPSQCAPKTADTLAWLAPPVPLGSAEPGDDLVLRWSRGPAVATVALELSRDDGVSWEPLSPASAASQWRWRVTGPPAPHARLRVRDAAVASRTAVTAAFAIVDATLDAASGPVGALSLSAAWPSPTRAGTQLRLSLPRAAPVRAEIVDVQGRVVRVLLARTLEPGSHPIAWDGLDDHGRTPSPGVMFARVEAGGERAVRRVVVMR